jgi:hypothetical protein
LRSAELVDTSLMAVESERRWEDISLARPRDSALSATALLFVVLEELAPDWRVTVYGNGRRTVLQLLEEQGRSERRVGFEFSIC